MIERAEPTECKPKKRTNSQIRQIPMCLPPTMIAEMDAVASREGMIRGRSTIARRAIRAYLDSLHSQQGEVA